MLLRAGMLACFVLVAAVAWSAPEDFKFEVLDASGYKDEVVTTSVMFSNTGEEEVQGWTIAIRYDTSLLQLVETRCGEATKIAQGGRAVDFCETDICDGGELAQGVVIDVDTGETLPPGESYEALQMDYRLTGNCPYPEGFTANVRLVTREEDNDTVCDPPKWTLVTVQASPRIPPRRNLIDGTIRCRPVPETNECCEAPPCLFPEDDGYDYMDTVSTTFRFGLYGLGTFNVQNPPGLVGPTIVYRSGRKLDGNNCAYVDTHLVDLYLEGPLAGTGDPPWRVVVTANEDPAFASRGTVKPQDCSQGNDFPAMSRFRLYFKIFVFQDPGSDEPSTVLFNKDPKIQRNVVCELPPVGQVEAYEPPQPINLYSMSDPDGSPVGQILGAHNPAIEREDSPPIWIRGDCNTDGAIDISDAVQILCRNFLGCRDGTQCPCPTCLAACDVDADGVFGGTVNDAVYLLMWLFRDGLIPPPPNIETFCGADRTGKSSELGCEEYPEEACLEIERLYLRSAK